MSTRRTARVASMIREVVSSAILTELRDPRIRNVTVLGAEVSPDLRYARVRVTIMGDEKTVALTMHGLNSATGYLRSRIGVYIKSRHVPELKFLLDDETRKTSEVAAILREVLPAEDISEESTGPAETAELFHDEVQDGEPSDSH
jgi:ribosome-binding factor A